MDREPTTKGPPACWGRWRGDADCKACRCRKSCKRNSAAMAERITVAEAAEQVKDKLFDTVATADPVDVLVLAFSLYRRKGGRPYPVWTQNHKFIKAMEVVCRACENSNTDPLVYVTAQIEYLEPMIQNGIPLCPGHFLGENADNRYKQWKVFQRRNYGEAERADTLRERAKISAAHATYARQRILGHPHADAVAAARAIYPKVDLAHANNAMRVTALHTALLFIDPALPHMLLMPATDDWTWDSVVEAISALMT